MRVDDFEGALNNICEVFALDACALGCPFWQKQLPAQEDSRCFTAGWRFLIMPMGKGSGDAGASSWT